MIKPIKFLNEFLNANGYSVWKFWVASVIQLLLLPLSMVFYIIELPMLILYGYDEFLTAWNGSIVGFIFGKIMGNDFDIVDYLMDLENYIDEAEDL